MKRTIEKIKNLSAESLLLPIFGLAFLTSCTPKTVPPVTPADPQTNEIPMKVENQTNTAERLALGQTIYDNSCGKCHDLPNPTDHSAQDWVGIMNWMAPKANLTTEQHEMVYDYVVSVKK